MRQLLIQIISTICSLEVFIILYLFAGRYKADPRFDWVPVDLTAFFFGLSVVASLFVLARRKFRVKRKALILAFLGLVFVIYIVGSLLWTSGNVYATQKTLYVATLTLWSLVVASFIIASDEHRLRRFFIILFLFACWIAVEAFNAYIQSEGVGFVTALGGNYLGIGRVLGLGALVILAYLLFFAQTQFKKILALVMFIAFVTLLLVAGGRGPLLATFAAFFVPLVVSLHVSSSFGVYLKRYIIPLTIIIGLVMVGVAYLFEAGHLTTTLYRLLTLLEPSMGTSAGKRIEYYVASIYIWFDNPIFGHGIGSWPLIMGFGDVRGYPHNILLEIMAELGIIGLLLFTGIIVFALNTLGPWRLIRNDPMRILILMLFVNTFLNAMVSGDLHDNRMLFAMLGLMALPRKDRC